MEGKWDVWNLGTGSGYSVKELISMTEEVTGKKIPTETIEKRSIDLAIPISNPTKAQSEFGWNAKRTLRESVTHAYAFLSRVRKEQVETTQKRVCHFVPYFPPHPG